MTQIMSKTLKKEKPLSRLAQKKLIRSLPPYVMLGTTAMRLYNPEHNQFFGWNDLRVEYYRDAGCWSVGFKVVDGKVYSVDGSDGGLNGIELTPISYTKWKKDNAGYINKDTKAYTI